MRKSIIVSFLTALSLLAFGSLNTAVAQFGGVDVFPAQEWDRRAETGEKVTTLGLDLMGENIDPHSGAISFSHTDISIPGNSALEVALRRKLISGYYHSLTVDAEFGDWTYDVPRMHVLAPWAGTALQWQGARCTNPGLPKGFPPGNNNGTSFFPSEYSNGLNLEVPGHGAQQVLIPTSGAMNAFPTAAKFVTGESWYLTCVSLGAGQEGFLAHAPNGDVYRFDTFVQQRAQDLGSLKIDGGNAGSNTSLPRVRAMLMASQVTDKNGNWVKYDYDTNGRLTRIHSNDLREITLTYAVSGKPNVVSSATANGRTWTYNYRTVSANDLFRNELNSSKKELSGVTRPDGRSWAFNLGKMRERVSPGLMCWNAGGTMTMTHPYGAVGTYNIQEVSHRRGWAEWEAMPIRCSGAFGNPNPPQWEDLEHGTVEVMAVTSKSISGSNMPTSSWTYSYESDVTADRYPPGHQFAGHPIADSENDPTNWTKVVMPNGSETTYYHFWNVNYGSTSGWMLDREETRSSPGGALLKTVDYDYVMTAGYGGSYVNNQGLGFPPVNRVLTPSSAHVGLRVAKTVIVQDGDTHTTESSFNTDYALSNYSYGHPVQTQRYSNLSISLAQPSRIIDTAYTHLSSPWVLGLPSTETHNGTLINSYNYDALGRVSQHNRFGQSYATYAYNSDGTVSSITDALSRVTQAQNWKRGTAQKVVRPDLTYYEQLVDNNGWLTSSRDPMGRITSYSRDTMGRLTLIDPTSNWTNTVISYSPSGPGLTQTITKGNARTTITHDPLLRPVLRRTQDLSSGWSSYVNMDYFPSGEIEFQSLPSTSATYNHGQRYTYDGLNRVLTETETAANAITSHVYMPNFLHVINDPSGRTHNYWSWGWEGPGNKELRAVSSGDSSGASRRTVMYTDIWGNIGLLQQWDPPIGGPLDQKHYFTYDSKQRLCRYATPSGGDTVYGYDAADQRTLTYDGLTHVAGVGSCTVPTGNGRITQSYDVLGRPTLTNYTDTGTPDISRSYNANDQLVTMNRSGINWNYTYNTLDLPVSETLTVDGLSFQIYYAYNLDGHVTNTTYPSGLNIDHGTDGLGRSTRARNGTLYYANNASFHSDGSLAGLTYGSGQSFTRSVNTRLLTQRLLATGGGPTTLDLNYSYDPIGRITAITDGAVSGNNRSFGYDGSGRLTSATGPWGTGTFTYDNIGNLLSRTLGSRNISLSYDYTKHRPTSVTDTGATGTRSIGYDVSGNITSLGSLSIVYDESNQPRAVSGTATGHGVANGSYRYDGHKRRVKSVMNGRTIYNVYDASGRLVHVRKMAGGGSPEERSDYVRAAGQSVARVVSGGPVYYSFPDHLGSPVTTLESLTGTSVTATHRERYTPYGIGLDAPSVLEDQADFTGHIHDNATGLSYMQARYYDPVLGRFLSHDPVTFFDTNDVRFFNRYAYVSNDPTNKLDPTGKSEVFAGPAIYAMEVHYQHRLSNAKTLDQRVKWARIHSRTMEGQFGFDGRAIRNEEIAGRPNTIRSSRNINFSQDSIGSLFSDGSSVQGLIDDLKAGKIKPNDLPPIRVFQDGDGQLTSLDNRRLYATQQAGVDVNTVQAAPSEVKYETRRKSVSQSRVRVREGTRNDVPPIGSRFKPPRRR